MRCGFDSRHVEQGSSIGTPMEKRPELMCGVMDAHIPHFWPVRQAVSQASAKRRALVQIQHEPPVWANYASRREPSEESPVASATKFGWVV